MTETPLLVKDDGMDVAGWNASPEGKLHPKGHDGKFRDRMGGAIRNLIEQMGAIVAHEEFGQADHSFSDHGVMSLHDDGDITISRIEEDGAAGTIAAGLSTEDFDSLTEGVGTALDDLHASGYPAGTHMQIGDDEELADARAGVSYGVMSDGTQYVSIDGQDGDSLQLTADDARDWLELAEGISARQHNYGWDKENPYLVRPLSEGETLLRRKSVRGDMGDDVLAALVDTPAGRRLRLGLGGNDDHPAKNFTGGPGPLVASLDAEQAEILRSEIDDVHALGDTHMERMDEASAAYDEWLETPEGQEFDRLAVIDRAAEKPDSPVSNAMYGRTGPPLDPAQRARYDELSAVERKFFEGLTEEGDYYTDAREIETEWGTVVVRGMAWSDSFDVRISVRPKGVSSEQWERTLGGRDKPEADLSPDALANLYRLIDGAFTDAQGKPITKSEGAAMNAVYAWAPITKSEKQPDGTLIVYGPASDASLDRDGQRMNQAWLNKAMPRWMAEGGNVREQHDPKRAVGVAVGLTKDDSSGAWMLASHIVDPVAVKKVEAGVLKGYSIGIKEPRLQMGKAEAPNGEIVDGYVCETSLVDRPSNPGMLFMIAKADSAEGGLQPVDHPVVVETEAGETEGEPNPWEAPDEPEPDAPKVDAPSLRKRDFSARQRRRAAKSGAAMENESFPIYNAEDLENAIHLWGNAKDPAAAKRHIISRARALGLTADLPEDWGISKADQLLADLAAFQPELAKADETGDIANAELALSLIARLIASEAMQMAAGRDEEADDIETLLGAYKALCWFKGREQAHNSTPETPVSDVDMVKEAAYKTESPELVKAVAEATAAEERAKDLETQVAQLKADMAAMPKPGGPVLTKTAQAVRTTTETNQRQQEAAHLLAKADHTADPVLRRGYRQRAAELLKADA